MRKPNHNLKTAILDNSLWLIAIGLCLASSGIDGAYMARWMTWDVLGYVLNSVSDVASLVITYWYGRLRQGTKAQSKLAFALLISELVAVGYSWFFSYLQLRIVLVAVEGAAANWIALIAAGFIPLLLMFVGYAQSLLDGKRKPELAPVTKNETPKVAPPPAQPKTKLVKLNATAKAILKGYSDNPGATKTQIAQRAGVSRTTVANYVKKLKVAKVLRENGNGIEIIGGNQ